jgi:hypothetical protein
MAPLEFANSEDPVLTSTYGELTSGYICSSMDTVPSSRARIHCKSRARRKLKGAGSGHHKVSRESGRTIAGIRN